MGRRVGGATKHTKTRPNVQIKTRPSQNISKHPKVYRPKKVLTKTVQHHGAAYGVHRSPETRVRQQQYRNLTVKVARAVGYPQHAPQRTERVQHRAMIQHEGTTGYVKRGLTQHRHQSNQSRIDTGKQIIPVGTKKVKKKIIRPQGAGQNPVNLNPFGLW